MLTVTSCARRRKNSLFLLSLPTFHTNSIHKASTFTVDSTVKIKTKPKRGENSPAFTVTRKSFRIMNQRNTAVSVWNAASTLQSQPLQQNGLHHHFAEPSQWIHLNQAPSQMELRCLCSCSYHLPPTFGVWKCRKIKKRSILAKVSPP